MKEGGLSGRSLERLVRETMKDNRAEMRREVVTGQCWKATEPQLLNSSVAIDGNLAWDLA